MERGNYKGIRIGDTTAIARVPNRFTVSRNSGKRWAIWEFRCDCGDTFYRDTNKIADAIRTGASFICEKGKHISVGIKAIGIRVEYECGCVKEAGYYVAMSKRCAPLSYSRRSFIHRRMLK